MKEFGVFPVEMNAGGKRTKFPADQLVDKAMETIVANVLDTRVTKEGVRLKYRS
jgi:hypothetical protein